MDAGSQGRQGELVVKTDGTGLVDLLDEVAIEGDGKAAQGGMGEVHDGKRGTRKRQAQAVARLGAAIQIATGQGAAGGGGGPLAVALHQRTISRDDGLGRGWTSAGGSGGSQAQ